MTSIAVSCGGGRYYIAFKTDNPKAYETVHEICRLYIDKEKQIPINPIAEERKDYEGNIFDVAYRCPKCNRVVCCDYENDIKEEYPYCNCGQALDWSDTE